MKSEAIKVKFSPGYFTCAVILLVIELAIGTYAHDQLIRPYGGDFLVVILIYCMVKSFLNTDVLITCMGVLLFSYVVEISQYFHLINRLGLRHSTAAKLILGTSFSWTDLLCYTLGIFLILTIERGRSKINFK